LKRSVSRLLKKKKKLDEKKRTVDGKKSPSLGVFERSKAVSARIFAYDFARFVHSRRVRLLEFSDLPIGDVRTRRPISKKLFRFFSRPVSYIVSNFTAFGRATRCRTFVNRSCLFSVSRSYENDELLAFPSYGSINEIIRAANI